jgi:glycosyltransferase involved in cell wall biosynthesis
MKVGWLVDNPGYIGGAELSQAEFRAAAPEGVEVVDCPPGGVVPGLDAYVVHNHTHYRPDDLDKLTGRVVRYHHDLRPQHVTDAIHLFCSPLQRAHTGIDGECIPPAIDYEAFKPDSWPDGDPRGGKVWLGRFYPGKGIELACEYATGNGGIDFYGEGPLVPTSTEYVRVKAPVSHSEVPDVLRRYKTFVHLPTVIEPFGRTVAEAWAAGCELVINRNVGAAWWISEAPDKLKSAGEDFWAVVCD